VPVPAASNRQFPCLVRVNKGSLFSFPQIIVAKTLAFAFLLLPFYFLLWCDGF
jgi:hypothetical protein